MNTPWRPIVELHADGDRLDASSANRPLEQITQLAQHLKEKVTLLDPSAGAMVLPDAPLDSETALGDFVYFNSTTGVFTAALAEAEINSDGAYASSESSFVVGIIVGKTNATLGDILQAGRILPSAFSITLGNLLEDPINDSFVPGRYYLSRTVPGKMTRHPASPSVALGYFSTSDCFIFPQNRDVSDTHFHYVFDLQAKPSASQNFDQTGHHDFGDEVLRVDYFNRNTNTSPPAMLLCVRSNGNVPAAALDPIRVDIYKAGDGKLGITLQSGSGLDIDDAQSTGADADTLTTIDWPDYGEWVGVEGTNLEFAFIREDGVYASTLATHAAALTINSDQWKVLLPQDMAGWTNANTFDLTTPVDVLYQYLIDSHTALNNVFPPVPAEAAFLQNNGQDLISGTDFKITNTGIFWMPGTVTAETCYSPWPFDYDADSGASLDPAQGKSLRIHFTKSGLSNANSVVLSLIGVAPIKVVRCPDGTASSTGNLQVSIDLALTESQDAAVDAATAYSSADGVSLKRTNSVAQILAGNGIRVERVSGGTLNTGILRLHRSDVKFEGLVEDICLRNAKEMVYPTYSAIGFPATTVAPSGITAMFKIPNQDYDVSALKLDVLGQFFGETAVGESATEQRALLKVAVHVIRPGFVLSSFNDANAVDLQYWILTFNSGYVATTMLSPEQPYEADLPLKYQINVATLTTRPDSLVALDGGYEAGDSFVLQIDRVKTEPGGFTDTYLGRLGLTSLRWILT